MPEPLIGETITDIDGVEAGELEVDLAGIAQPARNGGAGAWSGALEMEWRATSRLGLGLEVGLRGPLGAAAAGCARAVSLRSAASVALLHDPAHDFHLMAEASAQLEGEGTLPSDPGDPALPARFGLRAGLRQGLVTLRAGAGLGVGSGSARRVPLRTGLAVLFQVGPAGQSGFAGVEIDADWARRTPLVLAPQVVVDAKPLGLPALFGLALPLRLDPEGHEPRLGFLLRVMVEIDRG
jgi:hypothetical protein